MKNWKFIKIGNGISISGVGGEIPPESEISKKIYEELKNNGMDKDKAVVALALKYKNIPNARMFFESAVEKVMKSYSNRTVNESIYVKEDVMDVLRARYNKIITESQAYEKLKSIGMDEEKAKRLSKNPGNFTSVDFGVKNESIDKQTWSMFKGLSKDAEKEVGNAYTPNPELIKVLEAWLHNRMSEQEARAKIMKITGDKNITDMMIHSPGGFIPAGNKKTGNANRIVDLREPDPTGSGMASAIEERRKKWPEFYKLFEQGKEELKNAEGTWNIYEFLKAKGKYTSFEDPALVEAIDRYFKGKIRVGHKKTGNESIGDEYNAEIYRLEKKKMDLERMGQGQKAREIEKQIQQLQKELREYDIGNKKVGNARPKEQLLADVRELTKYIQEHNGQGCEKEKRLLGEAKEELDKNYGIIVGNSKTGNTGHWDSKKMIYSKWDDEKGRPSDEYARITWLGEGKGGLAVVWRGTSMTGVKYGSNSLEDLRRWAEEKIGNETLAEYAKSKPRVINGLSRARNAMTKNAMSISDLEAQIKKNEEYIKSLQGKTVDSEGWSAKASIREAQDEIDRMKSRIADIKEQGNKKVGNLDTVEEGDYVTVRFQGELVDGVVRKVQGTQALVTIDNTDVWFPIRSLKESI